MSEARIAMTAKIALKNSTIRSTIEDRPPAFQFADAFGRFLGMQFSHAPVVDVLAAAHRVGKVHLPIVALIDVGEGRGHAPLGHNRMRLAEQGLADKTNFDSRGRGLNGRAQSRTASANNEHVVFESFVVSHLVCASVEFETKPGRFNDSSLIRSSNRAKLPSNKGGCRDL